MKSRPDRKPTRLGEDQKTERQNACMYIQNTSSRKRQGPEESQINLKYNIEQELNSLNCL